MVSMIIDASDDFFGYFKGAADFVDWPIAVSIVEA